MAFRKRGFRGRSMRFRRPRFRFRRPRFRATGGRKLFGLIPSNLIMIAGGLFLFIKFLPKIKEKLKL